MLRLLISLSFMGQIAAAAPTPTPAPSPAPMVRDQGRPLSATGGLRPGELPPDLKAMLNAPPVPTPTEAERRIAPTVKKAETAFFLWVWLSILAKRTGLSK